MPTMPDAALDGRIRDLELEIAVRKGALVRGSRTPDFDAQRIALLEQTLASLKELPDMVRRLPL
jgi:hypothetical protein